MRITFHGVRGSTPVSGPAFAATGGHTSCISVALDGALPTLILDAGTGLQHLAPVFGAHPFRGTILLTHLHWDHFQGLPFFGPADRADADVVLVQPAQGDPVALLERTMSPPHFPIRPDQLGGTWRHVAIEPGRHAFGPFDVVAREVSHTGGRTFGYRIEAGGASFCYVPDAPDDDAPVAALAAGADLFVRGAPFLASEGTWATAYGHGTVEHAMDIARSGGVRRLVVTHHGPHRTDDALDAITAALGVEVAREGLTIDLGGAGAVR